MNVKFLEIKNINPNLDKIILNDIAAIIEDRKLIGGDFNKRFEANFADFTGSDSCVGVGNGLDAISLLIQALKIPKSKKIVIPNNTYIATALAVIGLGYELICCDVDPFTRNMSVETLREVIDEKVGLVIFVPLFGNPSGGSAVTAFCEQEQIPIMYDCAQAHGATINDVKIGKVWQCCTWSFYPGKNLGAYGDAGAVTSNDMQVTNNVRLRSNYGSTKRYEHEIIGTNSRLDSIQAAVLFHKLSELDEVNKRRRVIAERYIQNINNQFVTTPTVEPGNASSWHLFVVEIQHDRQRFIEYLNSNNIQSLIHYPKTIVNHDCFKSTNITHNTLHTSNRLSKSIVSLPIGGHLSFNEVDYVIDVVNSWS